MTIFARILVGLVAVFFLTWGLRFLVTPDAMATEFSITPLGIAGLSTIRGDLGGAFLAIGGLAASGLRPGKSRWLYSAAAIVAAIALGRLVGFAINGVVPTTAVPFATEVVFISVLLFGARQLAVPSSPRGN